jgi:hypothetical protein
VFPRPEIKELMNRYTLVQLHTDRIPRRYDNQSPTSKDENKQFQIDAFGDLQLPLYVIVEPLGDDKFREVARYKEGKINNVSAFADFLRKPLDTKGVEVGARE